MARISMIWKLSPLRTRVPRTQWTCCKTTLNSMIGRIRPRIQDQQPRSLFQLMGGMHWLWVGVALSAAAIAGPPAPPPPGTQPPPAGVQAPPVKAQAPPAGAQSPPQGSPDDDFIEFLGGDDVG